MPSEMRQSLCRPTENQNENCCSGTLGLLNGDHVRRLVGLSADALDLAGAARALGVSKSRIRKLVSGGLLEPTHRGAVEGFASWSFPQKIVPSLIAMLSSTVVQGSGETVGMNTAVEILRRHGMDFVGTMHAIRSHRLPVAELDQNSTGIKALRFRIADVRAMAAEIAGRNRAMTTQEAAVKLGLKWEVVAHLICVGLITKAEGGILPSALENFRESFVSGSALATTKKTSPRHVAKILARQGISPVVGPHVDGSRQNFYRRDHVTAVTIAAKTSSERRCTFRNA